MHCSRTLTFWLFVEILQGAEYRDIFFDKLPGIKKHTYIIRLLTMKNLPQIHEHFETKKS